jgi:hypothetical protein
VIYTLFQKHVVCLPPISKNDLNALRRLKDADVIVANPRNFTKRPLGWPTSGVDEEAVGVLEEVSTACEAIGSLELIHAAGG